MEKAFHIKAFFVPAPETHVIEGQVSVPDLTNSSPALIGSGKHGHRRSMLSQYQSAPSNAGLQRGPSRTHTALCKKYGANSGR